MNIRTQALTVVMLMIPASVLGGSYSSKIPDLKTDHTLRSAPTYELDQIAIEESILARASRLTHEEQLREYLGRFPAADAPRRYSDEARVSRLFADPAVQAYYPEIRDEWFIGALRQWGGETLFGSLREYVQCKVMIARNLYLRDIEPSAESVRREYSRIQALRERYRDLGLFTERRVVFAASGERMQNNNEYVFARGPIRRWIENQAGTFSLLRSANGRSRSELTEEIRSSLVNGGSLTFIYDGHGRSDVFEFGGGYSSARLQGALASDTDSALQQARSAILILNACRSHTLARNLLAGLQKRSPRQPLPIVIVPEEFGQDFVKVVYHEPFLRHDLRLAAGNVARLGGLFHQARVNTSVYVPDENNLPVQIA